MTVAETADRLPHELTVRVLARQHVNPLVAVLVGERQEPAVPEHEDDARADAAGIMEVVLIHQLNAPRHAEHPNDGGAENGGETHAQVHEGLNRRSEISATRRQPPGPSSIARSRANFESIVSRKTGSASSDRASAAIRVGFASS